MFVLAGIGLTIYGSMEIKQSKTISNASDKKNKMTTGGVFICVGALFVIGSGILLYMMHKNPVDMDRFSDFRFNKNKVDMDDGRF